MVDKKGYFFREGSSREILKNPNYWRHSMLRLWPVSKSKRRVGKGKATPS